MTAFFTDVNVSRHKLLHWWDTAFNGLQPIRIAGLGTA
jgi:hypothetical protein